MNVLGSVDDSRPATERSARQGKGERHAALANLALEVEHPVKDTAIFRLASEEVQEQEGISDERVSRLGVRQFWAALDENRSVMVDEREDDDEEEHGVKGEPGKCRSVALAGCFLDKARHGRVGGGHLALEAHWALSSHGGGSLIGLQLGQEVLQC